MPDGYEPPEPISVVLLGKEDKLEDTVVPRLRAAGADLNRITRLESCVDASGTQHPISFPRHGELLRETLLEERARLVIVDPLAAFLDNSVSCLNEQMARRALDPLTCICEQMRATLLLVRHLTKRGRCGPALYRGGGAIGIIGMARTGFLVGRDPDDPSLDLLAANKHNLSDPPPTLAYRVHKNAEGLPVIEWQGTSSVTADALVVPGGDHFGATVQRAVQFLQEALADDIRPRVELLREAAALGISQRTLERARAQLHVQPAQIRENGRNVWYWRLHLAPTFEEEQAQLLKRLSNPPDTSASS